MFSIFAFPCSNTDAPVCTTSKPTEVYVLKGEEAILECEVNSSPRSNVTFTWWANSKDIQGQVRTH